MASILGSRVATTNGTAAASIDFDDWWVASDQASGDWFFISASNDTGGTAITISGWTEIGTQQANAGARSAIFYRVHSGTEITAPTINGANDDWAVTAIQVRPGAGGTLSIDATADTQQTASTQTPTAPTVTTTGTNRLILWFLGRDGNGSSLPADMIGVGQVAAWTTDNLGTSTTGQLESQICWTIQPTAGTSIAFKWKSSVSDGGRQTTVALADSSNSAPAYIADSGIQVVMDWVTTPTVTLLSALHSTIAGITTAAGDATGGAARTNIFPVDTANAPLGLIGYYRLIGQTQTATTGLSPRMYGAVATISSTDYSNGLFLCDIRYGASVSGQINDLGLYLYFRDSSGGWCIVRPIATERLAVLQQYRPTLLFLPSLTQIDGSGTIDWADVVGVGPCIHVTGSPTATQNREYFFRPLLRVPITNGFVTIAGGSSSEPFGLRSATDALRTSGYSYQLPATIGAKLNFSQIPIRIGNGGTNPTYFNGNANAYEFVDSAQIGTVITSDDLEFAVNLGASDAFDLGASLVGCGTPQRFTIDAASSASAAAVWNGTLFGMTPTLNSKGTPGLSYKGCAKINAGGGDMRGCSFLLSVATDAAITITNGADLSGSLFIKGAETNAVEIAGNGPQTVTLAGIDLSAYTTPINVLGATGTITIEIDADDPVPTFTTAGATVVFDQPIVQSLAAVDWTETGSSVQVYNVTTATEIYAEAAIAGTSWTLDYTPPASFSPDDVVRVRIRKAGFLPIEATAIVGATGWSVFGDQETDARYTATTPANYTIDYTNKKIRATGSRASFIAQEIVDIVRVAEATIDGIRLPVFATVSGLVTLSPGVSTGLTVELNLWQLSWASGSVSQATVGGGNVVGGIADDPVEDVVGGPQVTINLSAAATQVVSGGAPLDPDAIAAAVWAYVPRNVNVATMNGATVLGNGTSGNKWRG